VKEGFPPSSTWRPLATSWVVVSENDIFVKTLELSFWKEDSLINLIWFLFFVSI